MGGQKGRGGLFRLEKEGLRAKGLSHTLAALGWQDQGHDTASRSQVFDHSIWGGHKGDRVPGLRTARLDLGLPLQRWGKQDRSKGTPSIEDLPIKLKLIKVGEKR